MVRTERLGKVRTEERLRDQVFFSLEIRWSLGGTGQQPHKGMEGTEPPCWELGRRTKRNRHKLNLEKFRVNRREKINPL